MKWKTDYEDYQMGFEAVSDSMEMEYWWESYLDRFNYPERMIFLTVFCFIIAFGVIGNLLTLYVIISR
jgi:hypothetical protein